MKFSIHYIILVACIAGALQLNAQTQPVVASPDTASYPYYVEMMQDPSANFYSVQSAFNTYWKDRKITRSCGWKPFKRWEYMMKQRLLPGGMRPAEDATYKAYTDYMQRRDGSRSLSGSWVNIGPFTLPQGDKGYRGLGRINAVGMHPSDPNTIYIGAPAGGLWKTTDLGLNWTSTTDQLPTLGVSAIAINPLHPDTVYIGTGDRDAGDAAGMGVMKSTDGGLTWMLANTGMGNKTVGRLLISPDDDQILFAATNGGIYKSLDGGQNWILKVGGNFKDLVFRPNDPTFMYGAKGGKFFRSYDSGETWFEITAGLASSSRGAIGVSPANPMIVYFFTTSDYEFQSLYRSTDGGFTFTERSNSPNIMGWNCTGSDSGGQAWYDLDIAVDPVNPDIIYSGGVDIWKSTDGGTTWLINSHWWGDCGKPAVHADQHIFEISPLDGKLYVGNDGGIYWTNNGGSAWHEISSGLAISQPYKLGQSATESEMVVNGYQDNGSSIFNGTSWYAVGGGDGMECAIDFTNPAYRYTTVYYGSIDRFYNNSGQGQIAGNGVNGINEDGDWVTPFILDEKDPNTMFIGYKNVWRSKNIKASSTSSVDWTKISDINTSNLTVLEQSPVNTNLLYASSSNRLYICENAKAESPTWYQVTDKLPESTPITDIETHPTEESTIYITQNTKVYRSADKGQTWTDISAGLPGIHLNTIVYYKRSPEGLYVGADAGVYYKDKSMSEWIPFTQGLPANGRITELEIYCDSASPANDLIKASTYGRGTWKSELYYNTPVADFSVDKTLIPLSCPVNFRDESTGVPFQWKWTFDGATPSASTDQNPENVIFPNEGIYDVKLVVSNLAGNDSTTKTSYISVSSTLSPVAGFSASPFVFCADTTIVHFTDTSKFCPITWHWSFEPNTVEFVNGTSPESQNPQVVFTNDGTYAVALTVTNNVGINTLVKNDCIIVGGYTLPFAEDFESASFASKGWGIYNPDNKVTWDVAQVAGNTPGTHAARIDIFNYNASPGRRDMLISPALDFSALTNVQLSFEHAYAKRYTSLSDSLIVYISDDCGTTWTRVFTGGDNNTGSFATAPLTTEMFIPVTPDDWCGGDSYGSDCNTIDLSAWDGKKNIKIAFESYQRLGNNIYIDNISVSSLTGITKYPVSAGEMNVFPNPANQTITLQIPKTCDPAQLSILNQQGQVVFHRKLSSGISVIQNIDISMLSKGFYFIRINTCDIVKTQKIIIE
ncbi:MAG: PKD domain-containing protein [Bacteroidota bacterium]